MFENVIDQPSVAVLTADLRAGRLPPSVLFSGPAYSGKLTAALELARVLSCEAGSGGWSCTCPSCLRHKELASPDTLILGARSCVQEIRAAAASLLSADPPSPALRYLFLRAVRKLTLRFHPVFADSPERAAKPASVLASLNEYLEELSPAYPAPDSDRLAKLTEAAVDASVRLEENFLYSSVPVGFVRSVSSWLRIKPAGKVKVLIVENTETMQDAARNAFLKILEEPPARTAFVLVSDRPDRLLSTIVSRTQRVAFPPLPEEVIARTLCEQRGLDADDARAVAHAAAGSYTRALARLMTDEDEALFFDLFVLLMRLSYMRKVKDMHAWAQQVASWGRERQKDFLQYCQRQVRENFVYNFRLPALNYQSQREADFSRRFARFVNERNVIGITNELAAAQRDIEQNVSPRMVFFDLALKMIVLLIQ